MVAAEKWIDRGGSVIRWRDGARALQLRIRDRFRVAVDRHRLRWSGEDQDVSSAVQRWVRTLWRDVSQSPRSSPRFYRKKVDKDAAAMNDSALVRLLQALAVPVIGSACHVYMHGLNHVKIFGAEKLHQALLQRPEGKPLITVSNHVASVDDPFVIASLLPPNVMLDARNIRWTLCATDRCFRNPMLSAFFRCVKVLPVSRGDGIYQKGMDMAISKLNSGGWVHIFPEGSRSRDGGMTMGSAKRGVGRLVMDADSVPIVVPFVHAGMQEVMPIGAHFPKAGKEVVVLVGDPIIFDDLLLHEDDPQQVSDGTLYDAVSSRIGERLQELKVQVDRIAQEQSYEVKDFYAHSNDRACKIWQQVDWEAYGMGSIMSSECDNRIVKEVIPNQLKQILDQPQPQKPVSNHQTIRTGFSYEGRISRIRGYMSPSELMGFAARGLFMNGKMLEDYCSDDQEIGPLKIWKQFFEGNMFRQWNSI